MSASSPSLSGSTAACVFSSGMAYCVWRVFSTLALLVFSRLPNLPSSPARVVLLGLTILLWSRWNENDDERAGSVHRPELRVWKRSVVRVKERRGSLPFEELLLLLT